jgi:hypothetical protein
MIDIVVTSSKKMLLLLNSEQVREALATNPKTKCFSQQNQAKVRVSVVSESFRLA